MLNENKYKARQKLKGGTKFKLEDFINITKPEISYILGFLWADGHIMQCKPGYYSGISFNITKTDYDELANVFMKYIQWTTYIRDCPNSNKQLVHGCIYDTKISKFLKELDYDKKSYISPQKILDHIPEYLHYMFWRGYFDGDGCIHVHVNTKYHNRYQLSISSTYNQDWTQIESLFKSLNITKYKIYRWKRHFGMYSCIELSRVDDILAFCVFIYQNIQTDNIGLYRKYVKYVELLDYKTKKPQKLSKHKGVTKDKNCNSWSVRVWQTGKYKYIGCYASEDIAVKARDDFINNQSSAVAPDLCTISP
jgi:hypothetical protein